MEKEEIIRQVQNDNAVNSNNNLQQREDCTPVATFLKEQLPDSVYNDLQITSSIRIPIIKLGLNAYKIPFKSRDTTLNFLMVVTDSLGKIWYKRAELIPENDWKKDLSFTGKLELSDGTGKTSVGIVGGIKDPYITLPTVVVSASYPSSSGNGGFTIGMYFDIIDILLGGGGGSGFQNIPVYIPIGEGGGGSSSGGNGGNGGNNTTPICTLPENTPTTVIPIEGTIPGEPGVSVNFLDNILSLDANQKTWLLQNSEVSVILQDALLESMSDEDPSTLLAFNNTYSPQTIASAKIVIYEGMNGILEGPYDEAHLENIQPFMPGALSTANFPPWFWIYYTAKCAVLRLENPSWSKWKIGYEAMKEMLHIGLDIAGLVPVIGEVADLTNGILYTLEGDGVNATLSFAATIPIAGWAATTAKYASKAITALNGSKRTLYWYKTVTGIIKFGDRGLLRKVLGLAKGDSRVAYHLVPWEHSDKGIIQKAAGADFHMNEILNGIPLTTAQHNGSHPLYNDKVRDKLQSLLNQATAFNWSNTQCANAVRNLANDIRNWIITHPNESINNIIIP